MIANKTICITGGAGFIGSTLAGVLLPANQVIVFDNFSRNAIKNWPFARHKNLTMVQGDVLDMQALQKALPDADYIIHCAGVAGIDTVIKSPITTLKVNMQGSLNLLEAALNAEHCQRVICFSTSEVFGSQALSSRETDRTVIGAAGQARWTYAVSKLAEEHMAFAYYMEKGLPTTVLRPFNIYGPGQVGEGALKIFITRALNNQPLHIYGTGTQIRAWCYVDDMVEAVLCAMQSPNALGESFNIGNNRSVETILGLANTVIRILKSDSEIEFHPSLSADIELRIPNVEKAQTLLNFTARVDLAEGIARTAEFFRRRVS